MNWLTIATPTRGANREHTQKEGVHVAGVDLRTAKRQELYVEGTVQTSEWPLIASELVDFWKQVAAAFESALPGDPPWDRLVVQIIPEGGQLKAFLVDLGNPRRTSPLIVNGIIPVMGDAYDALPDPEETPDEFQSEYEVLANLGRNALLAALAIPAGRDEVRRMLDRHRMTLHLRPEDGPDELLKVGG